MAALFVNGINYSGGGTTVVANPSSAATDDLEKIQIGSTIYDVGGGNANIWTGTQAEYEAQASQIADDTVVLITDDEEHTQAFDVYSTDEQVIGIWIDGSTLYRKVVDFETPLQISYDSMTNTDIDTTNIANVINVVGIHADGTYYGTIIGDPTKSNHTILALQANRNGNNITVKKLILEYTKSSS